MAAADAISSSPSAELVKRPRQRSAKFNNLLSRYEMERGAQGVAPAGPPSPSGERRNGGGSAAIGGLRTASASSSTAPDAPVSPSSRSHNTVHFGTTAHLLKKAGKQARDRDGATNDRASFLSVCVLSSLPCAANDHNERVRW